MKNLTIVLVLLAGILTYLPFSYATGTSGTVGLTILPSEGEVEQAQAEQTEQIIDEENQQNIDEDQEKEVKHAALGDLTGSTVMDLNKPININKIIGIIIFIGALLFAIGLFLTRKKHRK